MDEYNKEVKSFVDDWESRLRERTKGKSKEDYRVIREGMMDEYNTKVWTLFFKYKS